jgi:hypothetical protein
MPTLNKSLHQTSHLSLLMRKARRLGLADVEGLIRLAVKRGCHHFRNVFPSDEDIPEPGLEKLSQDELVVLLLHGNNRDEPMAIRCAAQLLKSKNICPHRVAFLAIQERCETPLKHIARHGVTHDPESLDFWNAILDALANRGTRPPEGILPHPDRFLISPGIQRGVLRKPLWLSPLDSGKDCQ